MGVETSLVLGIASEMNLIWTCEIGNIEMKITEVKGPPQEGRKMSAEKRLIGNSGRKERSKEINRKEGMKRNAVVSSFRQCVYRINEK